MKKISLFGLSQTSGGSSSGGSSDITIDGESCVYVKAGPDPAANLQALKDAIALAKTKTPYGNPLSRDNRITVFIEPGNYNDEVTEGIDNFIEIDFNWINLTCNVPYSAIVKEIRFTPYRLGVVVTGIKALTPIYITDQTSDWEGDSDSGITLIDCYGSDNSFTSSGSYSDPYCSGTFVRCIGGYQSFRLAEFSNSYAKDCIILHGFDEFKASIKGGNFIRNMRAGYTSTYADFPLVKPDIFNFANYSVAVNDWVYDEYSLRWKCKILYSRLGGQIFAVYGKTRYTYSHDLEAVPNRQSLEIVNVAEIEPLIIFDANNYTVGETESFYDLCFIIYAKNKPTDTISLNLKITIY